jgi:hypothetical protein
MAFSYALGPNPKWYFVNNFGRPLAAGRMYTYSSLDPTSPKYIYQDPAGTNVWQNPVLIDENGTQGPFYWQIDSNNPDETYYIEVYDENGVLIWTQDNYLPGDGGGSVVTTALDLENLITNNVFYRNVGTVGGPLTNNITQLAPGAHDALTTDVSITDNYTGPDIYFIKNNTNATDTISFPTFTLGLSPFTNDITPAQYMNYTCTGPGASETLKCVQFPITSQVQNLSNQNVTVTIWARCNSGAATLDLSFYQFFGDGPSASPPVDTPIDTCSLTSDWEKFVFQTVVPTVATSTLGECGNDGLFLRINYPLTVATDIDMVKPCVFIGNIAPSETYETNDMINAVMSSPRTGNIITAPASSYIPGYVIMNDGTIGSAASGATTRFNTDTFPLYAYLWNNVSQPSSNAYAPVTGGLGASAVDDFVADKPIQLTLACGRVLGGFGTGSGLTARTLGETTGTETQTLSIANLPAHDHPGSIVPGVNGATGPGTNVVLANTFSANAPLNIASQGNGTAHNNMQPTTFMGIFIKL